MTSPGRRFLAPHAVVAPAFLCVQHVARVFARLTRLCILPFSPRFRTACDFPVRLSLSPTASLIRVSAPSVLYTTSTVGCSICCWFRHPTDEDHHCDRIGSYTKSYHLCGWLSPFVATYIPFPGEAPAAKGCVLLAAHQSGPTCGWPTTRRWAGFWHAAFVL